MSVLLSKMEGEELRKYAIPKDAQRSVLEDTIFKVSKTFKGFRCVEQIYKRACLAQLLLGALKS